MKFRRINEDTVRCIVSKEDMQEYGIALEDFFKNKGKVHEFLHEIVERAEEEIGYEPKEGMLSMQIMPISQNTISITFSDHGPEDYAEMMNNIKDSLGGLQDSMGELIEDIDEDSEDIEFAGNNILPGFEKNKKSEYKSDENRVVGMEKSSTILIAMDSIEKMAEFCRALGIDTTVKSELYELRDRGNYCLIIEKGRMPLSLMRHIIILAVEYTNAITDETSMIAYVKEHGELIIEKGAYRILKKYI